jgi:hypothetical protein
MVVLFYSTIKINKLMPKILWDKDFLSSKQERKFLWADKLFRTSFKEYGIKSTILPDNTGKLGLNYTFYLTRKFVPVLNSFFQKTQPVSLTGDLSDVGVQVSPAVTTLEILNNNSIEVKVVVPLLPYTDIPHINKSIAKYRDILYKRLSLINRTMVSKASIDSDLQDLVDLLKKEQKKVEELYSRRSFPIQDMGWSKNNSLLGTATHVNINAPKLKGKVKP